eukprot:7337055-Alexandrium_andersonii.AAC.1
MIGVAWRTRMANACTDPGSDLMRLWFRAIRGTPPRTYTHAHAHAHAEKTVVQMLPTSQPHRLSLGAELEPSRQREDTAAATAGASVTPNGGLGLITGHTTWGPQ